MAGAPVGNNNAAKGKLWKAALERALEKRGGGDKVKAINELAEKFLSVCDEGDLAAFKELGDRLDGKAAQAMEVSGPEGGPIQTETTQRPQLSKEEWLKLHGLESSAGTAD